MPSIKKGINVTIFGTLYYKLVDARSFSFFVLAALFDIKRHNKKIQIVAHKKIKEVFVDLLTELVCLSFVFSCASFDLVR